MDGGDSALRSRSKASGDDGAMFMDKEEQEALVADFEKSSRSQNKIFKVTHFDTTFQLNFNPLRRHFR